jgi:hypothetical protein
MRPIFLIGLLFTVWFGGTLWYQQTAHICPAPIRYAIGSIDERFALTKEEAEEVAKAAETVWETALNRELFTYDEEADFPINFIYDERQQRARTEEEWRLELDGKEAKNEALIAEVRHLGAQYEGAQADYDTKRQAYEDRLAGYNKEVERYNSDGGAPEEVYQQLQAEAEAIESLQRELMSLEAGLRARAAEVNAKGEAANASVSAYNAEVLEYNAIFGESETYTQGDFERERINVYKFSDKNELEAVLVHEFGHALGIGHVEDPGSVMYYLLTERDSLALTEADREAFAAVCGEESTFASELRRIIRSVLSDFN